MVSEVLALKIKSKPWIPMHLIIISMFMALILLLRFESAGLFYDPDQHFQELPPDSPEPGLSLNIVTSAKGEVTAEMNTRNFIFTHNPRHEQPKIAQGHAHVFVNGKSHSMAFESEYSLGPLPPGSYKITVTLNSSRTHLPFLYHGLPIQKSKVVNIL